jgi:predicted molibdopterin-dependent oxidoreductase YjgC
VDPGIASGTADVFLLRRRDTLPDLAPAGLRVVIDSEPRVLPAGISVLDALHSVGIDVPTLCHDERLVPSGACRLCLVRIAGWPRLMPACTTTLAEGMEISTHTPEILDFRRFVLRSLAADRLHMTAFPGGARAALRSIDYQPTLEQPTPLFPFLLVTGRSLYQFNAGTMTGRTRLNDLRPADYLDIAPEDAASLGLHDGDPVKMVSAYGQTVLPVRVSVTVPGGQLFATFHTTAALLNAVTSPYRDAVVGTPEYKVTAVRLERLPTGSQSDAA